MTASQIDSPVESEVHAGQFACRLNAERIAATAGPLGVRVEELEATSLEVVVVVDRGAIEKQRALAVNDDLNAVLLADRVILFVVLRVDVEAVVEAAATATGYSNPQHGFSNVLAVDNKLLDFGSSFFRQG